MFPWPRDDEHTTIVGRNGSGKTQLGAWLLGEQPLKIKPWVMVDYKGDELLNSIEHVKELDFGDVPGEPGLYILHSRPDLRTETNDFLWRIYDAANIGVYIDEGYMIPAEKQSAYEALLTQGRALRIPVITLSQRPVWINRFALSEASHICVFHLNDKRDRDKLGEIMPPDFMEWIPEEYRAQCPDGKLPRYHSRWYALKRDERYLLQPVPDAATIRNRIAEKLKPPERAPSWSERIKGLVKYG